MNKLYQIDMFSSSVGAWLACSDDLGNVVRLPREKALKKPYIAPNNSSFINCLLFDIDTPEAGAAWLDNDMPQPNWICQNETNGHAHYGYQLIAPVSRTLSAHTSPQRYLARIQQAMTAKLGADRAYAHFLTKTPEHQNHRTIWGRSQGFDLDELAEWVNDDMPLRLSRASAVGEGRNVTLFDGLRRWSYRERLKYTAFDVWLKVVKNHAHALNSFDAPLPINEVESTAKSVAKWTWKHITSHGWAEWHSKKVRAGAKSTNTIQASRRMDRQAILFTME